MSYKLMQKLNCFIFTEILHEYKLHVFEDIIQLVAELILFAFSIVKIVIVNK